MDGDEYCLICLIVGSFAAMTITACLNLSVSIYAKYMDIRDRSREVNEIILQNRTIGDILVSDMKLLTRTIRMFHTQRLEEQEDVQQRRRDVDEEERRDLQRFVDDRRRRHQQEVMEQCRRNQQEAREQGLAMERSLAEAGDQAQRHPDQGRQQVE